MKIHLFFFILLFGVTILPARKRFPHYGSKDMRRECVKGNGRCKAECHMSEVRIAYCIRPGSHCCLQK
ncbi:beta-defensin 110-like [Oryx dammah]|uniref:beta-defensin 110-like n=1 Tax=Oryx dammah TaxID=59534 RepID=UPI001A9B061B|nr:beta-defensin 110-like [Oryx dammah]